MNRIARALKIQRGEAPLVLLVGALFLCLQAGQGLGDNAASALFFLRYGVERLPAMYSLLGVLTFLITLIYSAVLARIDRRRFFPLVILVLMGLLVVERVALVRPVPVLYPVLWLTVTCMGLVLGTFMWNLAGAVNDSRQAKRLFPLFASAGILGSVTGNLLTGPIASGLGTSELLVVYVVLLGLAYLATSRIVARYLPPLAVERPGGLLEDLRIGFDYVRGSPLMLLLAAASVLFSILFFSIAFPFSKVVTAAFPDESGVAGFLGVFSGLTTGVSFLVSLLLANRFYARLGIVNSVLLLPLTYVAGLVVFASWFNLPGGVFARFSQLVVLSGLASTAWSALFNVVPAQSRGQVLAFQNGVPSQVGVALSGLLLIVGDRFLTSSQILLMGLVVALACGWLVWRMRAAYGDALIQALRAGRADVFSAELPGLSQLRGDAEALRTLSKALKDPRPPFRTLAIEIMGSIGGEAAPPSIVAMVKDADPGVRATALRTLPVLTAVEAVPALTAGCQDEDPDVRLAATNAWAKLSASSAIELPDELQELLSDPMPAVRAQAALAFMRSAHRQAALDCLHALLRSKEASHLVAGLEAVATGWDLLDGHGDAQVILASAAAQQPNVRSAACHALAVVHAEGRVAALVACLADPDLAVREAAAASLKACGEEGQTAALTVLVSGTTEAADAAVDALVAARGQTSERLHKFVVSEIPRVRALRSRAASLPTRNKACAMLSAILSREAEAGEERLVRILGLMGDPRAMDLVSHSLHTKDSEARAAAVEALDTLADKSLRRDIIGLLEDEPLHLQLHAVLQSLLQDDDPWRRALAVRALQELDLAQAVESIRGLTRDPVSLVRDAAVLALAHFGQVVEMKTHQMISTLERVLLLRDVPIFAELSVEDLERMAGIAQEEWYPSRSEICHEGDHGDLLYIITEGQLDVIRGQPGAYELLARRGPGEFVGEMAIIEAAPRSATLRASADVRLLTIDGNTFKGILKERPDVALAVMRSLSRRLRVSPALTSSPRPQGEPTG